MKKPNRHLALKITTLIVTTACFVMMGSATLISQNFKKILTLWGEDVQLTVYLNPEISERGRLEVEEKLVGTGKVGHIQFVTQEKALSDFRVQLASYAPDVIKDDELLRLIPASLLVRLASDISVSEQTRVLQELSAQVKGLVGVDDVSYGQDWVEKYSALVTAIEMILHILGVVILAAALFVISNAIRASIQNRKEEIVVLEMIGATSTMIRKPFLIEGAVLGFSSSLIAVIICFVFYTGLKNVITLKLSFLQLGHHLQFLNPIFIILFVLAGAVLGGLSSYFCVRQINSGFAGSQG